MIASTVTSDDPYGTREKDESFPKNSINDESIDALLKETEKSENKNKQISKQDNDSSEDEFIDDDDQALLVNGVSYSYTDIQNNPNLVKQMTENERAEYTKFMTNLY